MGTIDDLALLREYAARNSEAAFETLVSRRVNFVYSAALRQVRDPQLAAEITQSRFDCDRGVSYRRKSSVHTSFAVR